MLKEKARNKSSSVPLLKSYSNSSESCKSMVTSDNSKLLMITDPKRSWSNYSAESTKSVSSPLDTISQSLILRSGPTPSYPLDNSATWLSQLTKASSPMKTQGPDTSEERLSDSSIDFTLFITFSLNNILQLHHKY